MESLNLTLEQLQNWPFKLGATFRLTAKELLARGWTITPFEINEERRWGYFIAEKDGRQELLASLKFELFTNLNSRLGYLVTTSKARTYEYARRFDVPVPESRYFLPEEVPVYEDFRAWPGIVIKPRNGSSGAGITVGVTDERRFQDAVIQARTVDSHVVIQEFLQGYDYRLLFLNYKLFAAIRRGPAHVIGDGEHSVEELIQLRNAVVKSEDHPGTTSTIKLAEVSRVFGQEFLRAVPRRREAVVVSDKANLSLGGDAYDVTDEVHKSFEPMLAPLMKSLGLRICGIDVLTTDISKPPAVSGAKVLEVNAAPNIRPHKYPTEGKSRDASIKIVDLLEQRA